MEAREQVRYLAKQDVFGQNITQPLAGEHHHGRQGRGNGQKAQQNPFIKAQPHQKMQAAVW